MKSTAFILKCIIQVRFCRIYECTFNWKRCFYCCVVCILFKFLDGILKCCIVVYVIASPVHIFYQQPSLKNFRFSTISIPYYFILLSLYSTISESISWSIFLFPLFSCFWKMKYFFFPSPFFKYNPSDIFTV